MITYIYTLDDSPMFFSNRAAVEKELLRRLESRVIIPVASTNVESATIDIAELTLSVKYVNGEVYNCKAHLKTRQPDKGECD